MTESANTIRIFISSPGDVAEEREKARRVIETLQRQYSQVVLQPLLWEDLALPATASFQESIDYLLHRERIDIAIFIIWSRLGSPLGPAIKRADGTPYNSGTEREFDLMLAAFEQSGQKSPIILAYTRRDETGFRQRLTSSPAAALEELISQRKLAENFVREHFRDSEGHNCRAYHSYPEPVSFAQRLHTHLRSILDERAGESQTPRWVESPYRGLEAFDTCHAAIFHGRDEESCDVLQRLRDQDLAGCAFVVIVGASGSGKSSLARAGVAAMLSNNGYDESVRQWKLITFLPALAGGDVNFGVARVVADAIPMVPGDSRAADEIANGLTKALDVTIRLGVEPAFERASQQAGGRIRLLVILDQLEELWTDRRITEDNRQQFMSTVKALASSGHIAFLATLRSDFYPHAQKIESFLELKGERGQFDLLPPGLAAIHRLIVEPARLAGVTFERNDKTGQSLDEKILQDASRDPAALPLLEYALSELYQKRDEALRRLTFAGYEAIGGVEGAIAERVNRLFAALPTEAIAALEEILPFLVSIDLSGDQAAVRRRAPMSELTATPARTLLVERLVAARLLTTDQQVEAPTASLAHEALLSRWDRITDWIRSNREQLNMRARIEQSQQRWTQQSLQSSLLLPAGVPLEEGRLLINSARHLLTEDTADFVGRSISFHDLADRRQRQVRGVVTLVMLGLTAASLLGFWRARKEGAETERQRAIAVEQGQKAARSEAAERERAEELRNTLYVTQLRAAADAVNEANPVLGNTLLQQCDQDLRKVEWYYVNAQAAKPQEIRLRDYASLTRLSISSNGTIAAVAGDRSLGNSLDSFRSRALFDVLDLRTARVLMHQDPKAPEDELNAFDDAFSDPRYDSIMSSIALAPGGQEVAVVDREQNDLSLWNIESGEIRWSSQKHHGRIDSVVFQPSGKHIVIAGFLAGVAHLQVIDASDGTVIKATPCPGVSGPTSKVVFSTDTRFSAWIYLQEALNSTEQVVIVDGESGDVVCKITGDRRAKTNCAAFNADASLVAIGDDRGNVRVYAPGKKGDRPVATLPVHGGPALALAFAPKQNSLATAGADRRIRLWMLPGSILQPEPMTAAREFAFYRVHDAQIHGLAWSEDGTQIVSIGTDSVVRAWKVSDASRLPRQIDGAIDAISFCPRTNVLTTLDGFRLTNWDNTMNRGSTLFSIPAEKLRHRGYDLLPDSPVLDESVAIDADAKQVAQINSSGLTVWEVSTGSEILSMPNIGKPVCFSVDGQRLFAANAKRDAVVAINLSSGTVEFEMPGRTERIALHANRPLLAVAQGDEIALWNLENRTRQQTFLTGHHQISALCFMPESDILVTGGSDGKTRVWDINTCAEVATLGSHSDTVTSVAFDSNGKRLLTGSNDETIKLWYTRTWMLLMTLDDLRSPIQAARFAPDGQTILASGGPTTTGKTFVWYSHYSVSDER